MREYEIEPELKKKLIRLLKRDKKLYGAIMNKMAEIASFDDIEHYKNLRYEMKEYKRVHIGHFVLIFKYDKPRDVIIFRDYEHHDKIYNKYFTILF